MEPSSMVNQVSPNSSPCLLNTTLTASNHPRGRATTTRDRWAAGARTNTRDTTKHSEGSLANADGAPQRQRAELKQWDGATLCAPRTWITHADGNCGSNWEGQNERHVVCVIPCSLSLPHVARPHGNLLTPIPESQWASAGPVQGQCWPSTNSL